MVPGWPARQLTADFALGTPDHLVYTRARRELVVRLCGTHHLPPPSDSDSHSLLRQHAETAVQWFCDGDD